MQLTAERQSATGAFYTPRVWADKAVESLTGVLGDLAQYTFYDPCAGEGALLDALPKNVLKVATTLEWQDVEILRGKGYLAAQYDMLREAWADMLPTLVRYPLKKLVILTNPPFVSLPASTKGWYAAGKYGAWAGNNAVALILLRLAYEVPYSYLATFSKADLFQGSNMARFRKQWSWIGGTSLGGFISPSMSWPGLKGQWPLLFTMWKRL